MTAAEALLRAQALIELARGTVKQNTGSPCEHCRAIPMGDRHEYARNIRLKAAAEKCGELARDLGPRPIIQRDQHWVPADPE